MLATFNGLTYVTPAIVGLAFRKIYRHRIKITSAAAERSMQYGSDLSSVEAVLAGIKADTIIESVLNEVEVPV